MRTLSAALQTAHNGAVQFPAYLVEVVLNQSTLRYTTADITTTWNAQTWNPADVSVDSLRIGSLRVEGQIVFGNADDGFGGVALGEGFSDKAFRVWGYDAMIGATLGATDPVLLCSAVGGATEISEEKVVVSLRDSAEFRVTPRAIVNAANGFTANIPAGRTLTINNISFILTRGR
jgi:hypothetical protein